MGDPIRGTTCITGSHNFTCHPTQANTPTLTPATRLLDLWCRLEATICICRMKIIVADVFSDVFSQHCQLFCRTACVSLMHGVGDGVRWRWSTTSSWPVVSEDSRGHDVTDPIISSRRWRPNAVFRPSTARFSVSGRTAAVGRSRSTANNAVVVARFCRRCICRRCRRTVTQHV